MKTSIAIDSKTKEDLEILKDKLGHTSYEGFVSNMLIRENKLFDYAEAHGITIDEVFNELNASSINANQLKQEVGVNLPAVTIGTTFGDFMETISAGAGENQEHFKEVMDVAKIALEIKKSTEVEEIKARAITEVEKIKMRGVIENTDRRIAGEIRIKELEKQTKLDLAFAKQGKYRDEIFEQYKEAKEEFRDNYHVTSSGYVPKDQSEEDKQGVGNTDDTKSVKGDREDGY